MVVVVEEDVDGECVGEEDRTKRMRRNERKRR